MFPPKLSVLLLFLLPWDALGCASQKAQPTQCCPCDAPEHPGGVDRKSVAHPESDTKYIWDIDCPEKVVCYFTSWAQFRKGNDRFDYSMLDAQLCTHLIFSFLILGPDGHSVVPSDTKKKDAKNAFKFIRDLKNANPKLKVYASAGGYKDTQTDRKEDYKALMKDSAAMQAYVESAGTFIRENGFDGLDLDYEYPEADDRDSFTQWVRMLRKELTTDGFDLTMALTASPWKLDAGYNLNHLAVHLDAIHVMAYDYHGSWEKDYARHHSPLVDSEKLGDIVTGIDYLLNNGVRASKIILGIPMYGKYWNVKSSSSMSPPVKLSPSSEQGGDLPYNQICQKVKNKGWNEVDRDGKAPYAFGDGKWVGYDTVRSVREKVEYAVQKKLGGAMVWELAHDDFKNLCGKGNYPLIQSIRRTFRKACMRQEL